jgi:uncharacterized protein (TIGR03118 family)
MCKVRYSYVLNLAFRRVGALAALFLVSLPGFSQHYQQINLVSDLPGLATRVDPNLQNPWGLARAPGGPWWVSNNKTGVVTVFDGTGKPFPFPPASPLVVTIPVPKGAQPPASPTGAVFNGTSDFELAPGKTARFIFVTEDGTISAWNDAVDPNAILKVDRSGKAVYKGVTISEVQEHHFIYAANFRSGRIEVFDTNFHRVRMSEEAFDDDDLPKGFAPFNVQAIGQNLYVTFAKQDEEKVDDVPGAGLGFVDVFSPSGRLLARLQHGPWFNAPWGVTLAPGEFGEFSHELLVGNFGSGEIAAFNPVTGKFLDRVRNPDNSILVIDGLWALWFGNSGLAGPYNSLFFTAGIQDEEHGLFGTLTTVPSEQHGDEP